MTEIFDMKCNNKIKLKSRRFFKNDISFASHNRNNYLKNIYSYQVRNKIRVTCAAVLYLMKPFVLKQLELFFTRE